MKLRPQFQLRFRDAEQFENVRSKASAMGISMNEWVIRKVESNNVSKTVVKEMEQGDETHLQQLAKAASPPLTKDTKSTHDPRTCRVYRCGQCAAMKGTK